jgi:hypothetical protein
MKVMDRQATLMEGQDKLMEQQTTLMEQQTTLMEQQTTLMEQQTTLMEQQTTLMEQQIDLSVEGLPDLICEVSHFPKEFTRGETELLEIKISNPLHYGIGYKVEIRGEGIIVKMGSSMESSAFRSGTVEGLQTEIIMFSLLVGENYFYEMNTDNVEFHLKIYDLDKNIRLSWQKYVYEIKNKGTSQDPDLVFVLSNVVYY